jgi:hypothetical protein
LSVSFYLITSFHFEYGWEPSRLQEVEQSVLMKYVPSMFSKKKVEQRCYLLGTPSRMLIIHYQKMYENA